MNTNELIPAEIAQIIEQKRQMLLEEHRQMETIQLIPIEKIIVNQYQSEEFVDKSKVLEIAESIRDSCKSHSRGA